MLRFRLISRVRKSCSNNASANVGSRRRVKFSEPTALITAWVRKMRRLRLISRGVRALVRGIVFARFALLSPNRAERRRRLRNVCSRTRNEKIVHAVPCQIQDLGASLTRRDLRLILRLRPHTWLSRENNPVVKFALFERANLPGARDSASHYRITTLLLANFLFL